MGRSLQPGSLGLRVVLYFARNPDEELTTGDIAEKFDVPIGNVRTPLARQVQDGMLVRTGNGAGRGRKLVYKAGQRLLVMIGEERITMVAEACLPVSTGNVAALSGVV